MYWQIRKMIICNICDPIYRNLTLLVDQHSMKTHKIRILCPYMIDPVITFIYLIFLQHYRAYIALNSQFSKPVFEEKSKKIR